MNKTDLKIIKSGFVSNTKRRQAGLACLQSVINFFGGSTEIHRLHVNSGAVIDGVSILGLCKAARIEGFNANGFKGNIDVIKTLEVPVVLHVSKDTDAEDFIVLYGWQNERFIVGDPLWGIIEYREDELEEIWQSKFLMYIEPNESFVPVTEKYRKKKEWVISTLFSSGRVVYAIVTLAVLAAMLLTLFGEVFLRKSVEGANAINSDFIRSSLPWIFIAVILLILILHFKKVFCYLGTRNLEVLLNDKIRKTSFSNSLKTEEGHQFLKYKTLQKKAGQLSSAVYRFVGQVPFFVFLLFASLVFLFLYSLSTGIVFLSHILIIVAGIAVIRKKIHLLVSNEDNLTKEQNNSLFENLRMFKAIRLLKTFDTIFSEMEDDHRAALDAKVELKFLKNKVRNGVCLALLSCCILSIFILSQAAKGEELILLPLLYWMGVGFLSVYHLLVLATTFPGAKNALELIYKEVEISDEGEEVQESPQESLTISEIKNIEIKELSFAFPGHDQLFSGLNLQAQRGAITVVEGASGSGKSVLFSLLNRNLPITEGDISINGNSWNHIDDNNWRELCSAVTAPQQMFNETVLDNIGKDSKTYNRKALIQFCREYGFDTFFREFANSYSTTPENMSSAQKQLLTFATALYKKPKLLLLDDPFNAMDEAMTDFCLNLLHRIKGDVLILMFISGNKKKSKSNPFYIYQLANYNHL